MVVVLVFAVFAGAADDDEGGPRWPVATGAEDGAAEDETDPNAAGRLVPPVLGGRLESQAVEHGMQLWRMCFR